MKPVSRFFEWTLNIASLLCVVLVFGLIAQRHFFGSAASSAVNVALSNGTKIGLSGVGWAANRLTLIMALSVGCHYCEESASFYRSLIAADSNNAFQIIAILPEEVVDSRRYLQNKGIMISDVRKFNLTRLGITGTPTLILVDRSGRVQASWIGKLSTGEESQVYSALHVSSPVTAKSVDSSRAVGPVSPNGYSPSVELLTASQLHGILKASSPVPVVDVRPRREYALAHISGALNIPLDELEQRAVHEVPRGTRIVMYCGYDAVCEAGAGARNKATYCSISVLEMRDLGFERVSLIDVDLAQLKAVGILVDDHTNTDVVKKTSGPE